MEALIGIGGVVVILALFAGLSHLEAGRRRRMIADVTRPTRRYDLVGEVLPADDSSLTPWQPQRLTPPGYTVTSAQPRHVHNLETGFLVPLATAMGTAICITIATGAMAWAFGWPAKTVLVTFALALVVGWAWRLGVADKLVWSLEQWTKNDLDHDGAIGRPAVGYAVVNPGQARATVAQQAAQNATETRTAALQAFCDRCYLSGTSEAAHEVQASGADRDAYVACRDVLFSLGLAEWKNPERQKSGWRMTTDPATCKGIIANHTI